MRSSTTAVLLALALAPPSLAQEPRFAIELTGGRNSTTAIYDHTVFHPGDAGRIPARDQTRLSLGDAATTGARVVYRVAGAWRISAEMGRGTTTYEYVERLEQLDGSGLASWTEHFGGARRTSYGLRVGRRSHLFATPLFVEPELGGTVHRLTVGGGQPPCLQAPLPPSGDVPGVVPGSGPCPRLSRERWARTYSVPSIAGGLTLGYRLARRASMQIRGQYSVGRVSTKEAFWVDYVPQFDYAEAPRSRRIESVHLSAGISVSP
jgi:hypothetical protein